jgi:hypothetical protein
MLAGDYSYADQKVAYLIAAAVVDYASDAEFVVAAIPPVFIPAPPAPPIPSTANGAKTAIKSAKIGEEPLAQAIIAGFKAMDPVFALFQAGLIVYITASFVSFMGGPATVVGVGVPAVPPVLAAVLPMGEPGGKEMPEIAEALAGIIHASFKSILITGTALGSDGGVIAGVITAMPIL